MKNGSLGKALEVGDVVTLNPDSVWAKYGDVNYANPLTEEGVVKGVSSQAKSEGRLYVTVEWNNGCINTYKTKDLILQRTKSEWDDDDGSLWFLFKTGSNKAFWVIFTLMVTTILLI